MSNDVSFHGANGGLLRIRKQDREAAKLFLKRALANSDSEPRRVFARDRLRSYPAAVRELQEEGHLHRHCQQRTKRYCNNRIESDHGQVKRRLRAMQGPRTEKTAWAVVQGIEAAQMIRKGKYSGSLATTCMARPWVFFALLDIA